MSSIQYTEVEETLVEPNIAGFGMDSPVVPVASQPTLYAGAAPAGVPDGPVGALHCGVCHKAWGGDVACADCGAMVYGPQSLGAPDSSLAEYVKPSGASQVAVEAAVANAVRPRAAVRPQSTVRHPASDSGPTRIHPEPRSPQGRPPRPAPAPDSPLLRGGDAQAVVLPPQVAMPMAAGWSTPTGGGPASASQMGPGASGMTLTPGQPSGPAVAQPLFGMSASERPPTGVFGTYLATGRWSDTSELHVIEPLRPSYQGMARVAPTRPIDESEKRIPQVMEKVAAAVAWLMVIITAAVWWRANAGVQDCKGGCDDLAAVVNGLSGSGTAVVILSLIAMVAAAFSLRKTHSTDATRALGALALIAAVITMILGIVLFNVTLP